MARRLAPPRRRALITAAIFAAVIGATVAILALHIRANPQTPELADQARRAALPAASRAPDPPPSDQPGTDPRRAGARYGRVDDVFKRGPRDVAQFYAQQAADYRRQARYPKYNEPLSPDGTDPLANDNARVRREKSAGDSEGFGPVLVLNGPMSNVVFPGPVVVTAWVQEQDAVLPMIIQADFDKGPPNPLPKQRVAFRDDGRNGDEAANDNIYTWQLAPQTPEEARRWDGMHNLYVTATITDAEHTQIFSSIGWQYSTPAGANLTGNYRDAARDGSLLIESEVRVDLPGRYHLQLALFAQNGTPLVWAQNEAVAAFSSPGTYWIPITVYGILLADSKISGPYVVKRIWLRNVSEIPARVTTMLENVHVTRPYSWEDFTTVPFNDPVDLSKAEFAEKERDAILAELGSETANYGAEAQPSPAAGGP
ncbi:MAG: hypothetical protein HYV63_06555 [Candidatus Schekmanbacteria bacterium]|nr:hypothetical protein [Candidatus Schekmanbacteria bacterium]